MILSAHQPAYLPWLGYFEKISKADIFVYLDSVQYEKNSFINRNKIKTAQGPQWLTIPVFQKGHTGTTLSETLIDESQNWRIKHLRSIELNYRKSRYFDENFPKFQKLLTTSESNLSELCWNHLHFWLSEFEIKTQIIRSSSLPSMSKKSDLVLDLCTNFGADNYLSGALGRGFGI